VTTCNTVKEAGMVGLSERRRLTKAEAIVEELRRQIIAGAWRPGQRLPTREELVRQYATSRTTVQAALDRLRRDGFVDTTDKVGSFVAEWPPHLSRIGLVFPWPERPGRHWSRFWRAIRDQATAGEQLGGARIHPYYADFDQPGADVKRLVEDIRAQRFAGIIFGVIPPVYAERGLLELIASTGIPQVGVTRERRYGIPGVYPDERSFLDLACQTLAEGGRRRVAILSPPHKPDYLAELAAALVRHGLQSCPEWRHTFHLELTAAASSVVQLLAQLPPERRPDGLLVTDDNLLDAVVAGLASCAWRVPEELLVVSDENFPNPAAAALPVARIGFDAQAIIGECLNLLERQRQEQPVADITLIPARRELPPAVLDILAAGRP